MVQQQNNLPRAWQDEAMLDGLDLTPKAELIGVPFRITGASFRTGGGNNADGAGYVVCDIDAEFADGRTFTFNDSSTGVKAQIVKYLSENGHGDKVDTGEYVEFSIVIPKGLRDSEFDTTDERGRPKKGRTFYLTTSGRRTKTGSDSGSEPAPKSRSRAAVKSE